MPARGMALVSALTSMNIAEVCGLQWRHLNLTTAWVQVDDEALPPLTIAVRQHWAHGQYGTLKRAARRRNVPICSPLLALFRDMGPGAPDVPVFAGKTGKPIDGHNVFNRVLRPVGIALGLPWLGWHSFRRTHSTLAAQLGMAPADQMAGLGHSDFRMTVHYQQADVERRRAVLEQMGGLIGAKAEEAGSVN
jgi:integrase